MKKYIDFISHNRKKLLVLLVVLNILALIGLSQVKLSSDFNIFSPVKSAAKDNLNEMEKYFPASEEMVFMIEENGEIDLDIYKKLARIQLYILNMKNVDTVNGIIPQNLLKADEIFSIETINKQAVDNILRNFRNQKVFSAIVEKDGKTFVLNTVFINKDFKKKDLNEIENYLKENNIKYYISGNYYMQLSLIGYLSQILLIIPPLTLLLILLVFRLQLGNMKSTILSLLPAGMGALWTMGIVGWIGREVSIVTVLAPIFAIVIGSADGLHFISHVQDSREEGNDKKTSLVNTLRLVGIPMIITTVTSIAGFLALLIMNTSAIKDLAVFASLGVLLAGIASWYVIPLILTGDTNIKRHINHKKIKFNFLKKTWGLPSIIIFVAIIILFIFTFGNLKTEFNMLMVYRKGTEVYKNNAKIVEINGGSLPLYIYGIYDDNPLLPQNSEKILKFEDTLMKTGSIGKVASVYDLLETFNENVAETSSINPENTILSEFINSNEKAMRLAVFPIDQTNETLDNINKEVENFNKNNSNINLVAAGTQYLLKDLNNNMIENQVKSSLLALVLVFLLFYISIRKFKISIYSLLPIVSTMAILIAFISLTNISLNILTTTIFSISIGVGIDYAIHFTSVFNVMKKQGMSSVDAVDKSYSYAARPIISNALGLSLGFSALQLSPLQIHVNVSILMWVAMITSVFFSLSFLPTIFRKLK